MKAYGPTEYAAELKARRDELDSSSSAARWEGLIFGFLIGVLTCLAIAMLK